MQVYEIEEGAGVMVEHDDNTFEQFVKTLDGTKVHPATSNPSDESIEELNFEGYDVGRPLNAEYLVLRSDAPECNECNLPYMEENVTNAGGTPTTPAQEVEFECPSCGRKKTAHRRQQ